MIDLGYKMPLTTKKTGFPDGIFGNETKQAVIQFQRDEKIKLVDGIAGRTTIGTLDRRLAEKFKKPVKPPKPMPVIPSDKNYTIGTVNPSITPDAGAGIFNSKSTEASMWALKQSILEILPPRGASASVAIGRNAAINMKHYLDALGTDIPIDLENMLESGPTAKGRYRHEVSQAKKFVETLAEGTHQITSKSAESAYNYKSESWDWFYAIGGYSTWGKGVAKVSNGGVGKIFEIDFEYHFFDRYNWDGGKKVTIGPITITDECMGEFHRQGLAKEYNTKTFIKRKFKWKFKWKQGEAIPEAQYNRADGR